jgi:hypothetical protein
MTWSTCYGRKVTQHTIVIRILHDVKLHNQLQAYQSSKLIDDTNTIVKSMIGMSFPR